MFKNACRTCSTIILVLLTNNITAFWRCRCRSRRRFLNSLMTGCGLTKLHILQWSSQGGPGVPVIPPPPPPLWQTQTISVRLEQTNLCHLQLASCTIDLRRPWTSFFFSPLHRPLISGKVYTKAVSHRHGCMTAKPCVKIDAVWKCLHGTVFARKSKS